MGTITQDKVAIITLEFTEALGSMAPIEETPLMDRLTLKEGKTTEGHLTDNL